MVTLTKQEVIDKLKAGTCNVGYLKADGSIRYATATLNEALIPQVEDDKPKRVVKENPGIVRYYDVEKQGWRSFTLVKLPHLETKI